MEIIMWIIGGIFAYIIYAIWSGGKREYAYRRVIADLAQQMERNPHHFFKPYFERSSGNFVDSELLAFILFEKIIELSLERKIRSPINANIIPSDITTLIDTKQDFEQLYDAALYTLSMLILNR